LIFGLNKTKLDVLFQLSSLTSRILTERSYRLPIYFKTFTQRKRYNDDEKKNSPPRLYSSVEQRATKLISGRGPLAIDGDKLNLNQRKRRRTSVTRATDRGTTIRRVEVRIISNRDHGPRQRTRREQTIIDRSVV